MMKKTALFTLLSLLVCLFARDASADPFGWQLVHKPITWRSLGHMATALDDGTVLVAGGMSDCKTCIAREAEVWDAATSQWIAVADMSVPRIYATATKLPDGRVLVAGGGGKWHQSYQPLDVAASVEVYDPATSSWTELASMTTPRFGHTATRLLDDRILVAGGAIVGVPGKSSVILASAEVYDPGAGTWTAVPPMITPRWRATATLLDDGRVLVAGGRINDIHEPAVSTAELYDPAKNAWTPVPSMRWPRVGHVAFELPDHRVLLTGGAMSDMGGEILNSTEIFDPALGTWTEGGAMALPHVQHDGALLPSGHFVVTCGYTIGNAPAKDGEVYDPVTATWGPFPSTVAPHYDQLLALTGSHLLLVGGPSWATNAEVLRLRPPGEECDAAFECASGFCVEHVCCDAVCDGCETCTAARGAVTDGVCSALACGAYTCDASRPARTCLTECATSADCATGLVCEAETRTCVEPRSTFVAEGCAVSSLDAPARGPLALLFAAAVLALFAARRRGASRRGLSSAIAAALVALVAGLCSAGCTADAGSLCGPGLSLCGDQCADLATDPLSCGACGKECSAEELCVRGRCALGCFGGTIRCGDRCADTGVDPENCGECGVVCEPGQICDAGQCALAGGLTSYVFPGGLSTGDAYPRDLSFVLAAEAPATIHYTVDGSTPAPGAPGTLVGTSPITLPATLGNEDFSSKVIQWFADYAAIGREATIHSYFVGVDPGVQVDGSVLTEGLDLNGGGPVITVPAGATIHGKASFQIWRSKPTGACPGCIVQYTLGVDGHGGVPVGAVACVSDKDPGVYPLGTYPGATGTIEFTFEAPAEPGRHFVRDRLAQEYKCADAKLLYTSSRAVGLLIVY